MADITLLFGVDGGGQIDGKSGKSIASDIAHITHQIEETCTKKMEFAIDQDSLTRMKSSIEDALKDINIEIKETKVSEGTAKDIVKKNGRKSAENTLKTYEQVDKVIAEIENKISNINNKRVSSSSSSQVQDLKDQIVQLKELEAQGAAPEAIENSWNKLRESVNSTGTAIDNALKSQEDNKTSRYDTLLTLNKELYSLKKQQLSAGKNESDVLQKQIDAVEKRRNVERNYLTRNKLSDPTRDAEIDKIKEAFDVTQKLSKAKEQDAQETRAAAEAAAEAKRQEAQAAREASEAKKEEARAAAAAAAEAKRQETQSYNELSAAIKRKFAAEEKMNFGASDEEKIKYQDIIDRENAIIAAKKSELKITDDGNDLLSKKIAFLEKAKQFELEFLSISKGSGSTNKAKTSIEDNEFNEYDKRVQALVNSGSKIFNSPINDIYKETDELKAYYEAINKVNDAWNRYKTDKNDPDKKSDLFKTEGDIQNVETLVSELSKAEESAKRFNNALSSRNAFTNNITQNNKMLSEARSYYQKYSEEISRNANLNKRWQDIINKLSLGDFTNDINRGRQELALLKSTSQSAGIEVENLTKKFRNLFSQHLDTAIAMTGVHLLKQGLREVYESVKDVNTAMTELRKVTEESESTYKSFMQTAEDMSVKVGATLSDTITSTADFARLGYSISDSSQLAEAALVYKNVGDGITDINEASQSIISTMKAFGIAADDAMGIVDRFNIVGNNFAISSSGIGEALQRSAASLAAAGNTIEESIALVTAANSVVQDETVVGTSLKTISMYLRAAKTEAQEAGIETDGMAESVSKLQAEIKSLTGVDIMLGDGKTYKSTLQILQEIAAVWEDLSDISRANVSERLAGKRQANVLMSLLTNFDTAKEVLTTASDATGSALAENEKYLQSVNGATAQLQATFESFSNNVLSSDLVVNGISFLSGILEFINELPSPLMATATAITTIGAAYAGIGFGSNGKTVTLLGNDFLTIGNDAKNAEGGIRGLGASIKEFFTQADLKESIGKANKQLNDDVSLLTDWGKDIGKVANIQEAFNEKFANSSGAVKNAGQELIQYGGDVDKTSNAIKKFKDSQQESIDAAEMQTWAYKRTALAAKTLSIAANIGIQLLIQAGIQAVAAIANMNEADAERADELKNKAKEAAEALENSKNSADELAEKYDRLSRGVNALGKNVSLTDEEFKEYKSTVSKIAEMSPSIVSGYNDEGTALLNTKNITSALADEFDRAAEAAAVLAGVNFSEIYKGYKAKTGNSGVFEAFGLGDTKLSEQRADIKELADMVDLIGSAKTYDEANEALQKLQNTYSDFNENGINFDKAGLTDALKGTGLYIDLIEERMSEYLNDIKILQTWDNPNLYPYVKQHSTKQEIEAELKNYELLFAEYSKIIKGKFSMIESEFQGELSSFVGGILAYIPANIDYKGLSDSGKSLINSVVANIDEEFISKFGATENTLKIAVQQHIINTIKDIEVNNPEFANIYQKAVEAALKFNSDEITASEFKESMNPMLELISELPDETTKKYIKIVFDVEEGTAPDNLIQNIIGNVDKSSLPSDPWTAAKELEPYKEYLLGLTNSELKVFYGISNDPALGYSFEAWKEEFEKASEQTVVGFNISGVEEQIDVFQDSIGKYAAFLKSIKELTSDEILDLMQANTTFNWEAYGVTGEKGVGRLSDAIKTLATDAYVELRNALQAAGTSDELISVFEEIYRAATNATQSLEDLTASLTDYESNLSALAKAEEEQSKNGQLTTATYISLLKLGEDYSNCITIENGIIKLNTQAAKELTKAKLEEETATDRLTLSELSLQMARAGQAGDSGAVERIYKEIDETNKRIREKEAALANEGFDWRQYFTDNSSKSDDPIKDAFDKEFTKREHWAAMSIDDDGNKYKGKDLYAWLDSDEGYKKYFTDVTKYQEEIWKQEEAIHKFKMDTFDDENEKEKKKFDENIEKYDKLSEKALEVKPSPIAESFDDVAKRYDKAREYLEKMVEKTKNRIAALLSSGREDVEDEVKALNQSLETLGDDIEDLDQKELDERIEKEESYWENQKSLVEDAYDAKIKEIEDEADALDKRNEKEEKQLAILEAEKKLKEAKENRNQLILKDGNYSYEVDQDAVLAAEEDVKTAEQALAKFNQEEIVNTLKAEKDEVTNIYNSILEMIELYKNGVPPAESDLEILNEILTNADTTGKEKADQLDNVYDTLTDVYAQGKSLTSEEINQKIYYTLGVTKDQYNSTYDELQKMGSNTEIAAPSLPSASEATKNISSNQIQTKTISVKFRDIAVSVQGRTSEEMLNDFANKLGTKIDSIVQSKFSK